MDVDVEPGNLRDVDARRREIDRRLEAIAEEQDRIDALIETLDARRGRLDDEWRAALHARDRLDELQFARPPRAPRSPTPPRLTATASVPIRDLAREPWDLAEDVRAVPVWVTETHTLTLRVPLATAPSKPPRPLPAAVPQPVAPANTMPLWRREDVREPA